MSQIQGSLIVIERETRGKDHKFYYYLELYFDCYNTIK